MKLHWSPRSPFVRKVMIAAHELGLADRIALTRTLVAMTEPNHALLRENPLGKIPTLITDDGRILFDSIVICEYLDALHDGPRLFPPSGADRWDALRWHALGNGMLETLVLWRSEGLQPAAQQNKDWLATFAVKIQTSLDAIERDIDGLERAPFGIGHITIGCALGYLDFRFTDLTWRQGRPRATAWYAVFSARPSAQRTLPVDE
jgi:glutathione S-transferase